MDGTGPYGLVSSIRLIERLTGSPANLFSFMAYFPLTSGVCGQTELISV
jgi:hypothetical protein